MKSLRFLPAVLALTAITDSLHAMPRGYGYTATGQLFSFDLTRPDTVTPVGAPVGANVRGLDLRPTMNTFYAFDIGPTNSRLYTVNPTTGVRTAVGGGFLNAGISPAAYTLNQTAAVGFDFNPTTLQVDGSIRIRLVDSNGTDLRLNSNTGAIAAVDGTLAYSGGSPATVAVGGAAYINTDVARVPGTLPPTQLYYLESANDNLVTIVPPADPNLGVFTTVGALGVDIAAQSGFDVFTGNGVNRAFAAVTVTAATSTTLHTINLQTGAASLAIGAFPVGFAPAGGFAITTVPDVPPQNVIGYAYTAAGQLFSFNVNSPNSVTPIGLPVGTEVKGVDFRPGTTNLYAFDVGSTTARLFTVNRINGVRTEVGNFSNIGIVPGSYSLDATANYGFDFNPTTQVLADGSIRIRVVNDLGADLRINSDTAQVAAVDPTLGYAGGTPATSSVSGAGYTNSDTARPAGTAPGTQLFYIDTLNDALVGFSASPNGGLFETVGPLGVDAASGAAFDIIYTEGSNIAYAALKIGGAAATLHRIDLITGQAGPSLGTFPPAYQPASGIALAVITPDPAPDVTRPQVQILRPGATRSTVTSSSALLRGRATDNIGISRVEVKRVPLGLRRATGKEVWSYRVSLRQGQNRIMVRAFDTAGNISAVRRLIIRRN